MAEQVQKKKGQSVTTVEPEPQVTKKVDGEEITDAIDDLLDEINSVLEENAEEFIANYVQKGGQ